MIGEMATAALRNLLNNYDLTFAVRPYRYNMLFFHLFSSIASVECLKNSTELPLLCY